ncbi:MAG: ATP-dependent helicase [Candidatus Binataceae bacterium]
MSSINLDDLNPAQRAAATASNGPILILAGAGSGKTRVLTYRIAHLIAAGFATAPHTLAVTFTNKAASEMRERIATLLGGGALPWVSTFHSACARILRNDIGVLGYNRNFSIVDEGEALAVIRRVLGEAQLADSPPPELMRARIDQAKNEALTPRALAEAASDSRERILAQLYELYQLRLREMNALDFGDLLLLTHQLFETDASVLERWQRHAGHLLVDEYQDTNHVQYLLVRALSARTGNLCVVGDEDQSIYRWRGADIRNILDFERDYPNARIFKLEQNYRSTKTILAAADAVIQNNRERKPKRLWTENANGELVVYYTGLSERDEADFVAGEIARLTDTRLSEAEPSALAKPEAERAGESASRGQNTRSREARSDKDQFRPADIVVFYRVNAQSRVLEEALVRRRIPYYIVGGLRFYEHREVKDLLAYLRVLANPADSLSLERMIGTPPRGIGARTLELISEVAARDHVTTFEALGRLETESRVALRTAKQAGNLYSWMRNLAARISTCTVREIVDEVLSQSDYTAYLEGHNDGATRLQNLAEVLSAAANFDNEHGPGGLSDFLERVALINDSDQVAARGGSVALMTLHTSKGLEYPIVFITGMEEGLFPHNRAHDNGREVEEERRLCYVGMTRAQRLLYLTNTLSRELYGQRQEPRPSRFLAEVSQDLLRRIAPESESQPILRQPREPYIDYTDSQLPDHDGGEPDGFTVGSQVIHQTFGRGVVRRREGRGDAAKVWINFERAGVKLLVLKFANLKPVAR